MERNILVLVADGEHAKFFNKIYSKKLIKSPVELNSTPEREATETKKSMGRSFDSFGSGRHIIEPHTSDYTIERQKFAHQIDRHLRKVFDDHREEKLAIIAPPKMLGLLRKILSKSVLERVILELDKDLVKEPIEEVNALLEENLKFKGL